MRRIPADLKEGIAQNGIYFTGGVSNSTKLLDCAKGFLDVPLYLADEAELATIKGIRKMIMDNTYQNFSYSMLGEEYRWLR